MTSGSPTGALGLTRLLLRVVLVVVSLASSSSSLLGGIAGVCRGQNRAMKIANDRTLVQKSPPRHDNKHSMTRSLPRIHTRPHWQSQIRRAPPSKDHQCHNWPPLTRSASHGVTATVCHIALKFEFETQSKTQTELTPGGAHGITDNVHQVTDSNDPKLLLLGRLGWWGGGARHVGDTHFQEAAKV